MASEILTNPDIAVLIPCYQEEQTIGKVIADFRRVLPKARIFVYDNNCTDATAEIARKAGAMVRREKRQGKGFVVATMFEQVDADVLVMVDGDDTYEAEAVSALLEPILKGDADMTAAARLQTYEDKSFRPFHLLGNKLICGIINWAFHSRISDIFSGYRAFTREAAAQIPITAAGFDVETELTLQALYRGFVIKEIPAPYRARPEGSFSKLRTFSDGLAVMLKLFLILKSYKPLTFFGLCSIALVVPGLAVGFRPVYEYITERYVYAVPSAVLAAFLIMLSFFTLGLGLILNSTNLRLLELEKLICKRPAQRSSRDPKP
ncbi:MAG TPA: glycosyltransferase [Verrucomicrobiota bacterium]|nr:glycosyltransferase [Verrucomicrobiota bacterium]HQL79611.1 glycosyltransferase [Verrucomicrobiota bacterium]